MSVSVLTIIMELDSVLPNVCSSCNVCLCVLVQTAECFGYPISIFFIVVNEFCERFSYYGMRGKCVCLHLSLNKEKAWKIQCKYK